MSETPQSENHSNQRELLRIIIPVIIGAFLGFVGGLITARYQFITDTRLQNQSYMLEVRQAAYSNFFEGQAKKREFDRLVNAGVIDENADLRTEYNLAIQTSLFQIVMFGSKEVNEALAEDFKILPEFDRPCSEVLRSPQNEVRIYQNMRKEVFGNERGEQLDDNTIMTLLFRCRLD